MLNIYKLTKKEWHSLFLSEQNTIMKRACLCVKSKNDKWCNAIHELHVTQAHTHYNERGSFPTPVCNVNVCNFCSYRNTALYVHHGKGGKPIRIATGVEL